MGPFSLWYNASLTANHVTSTQVLVNGTEWVWIENGGLKGGADGASVTVDVSGVTGEVDGLRYAWTDILYKNPCCGDLDVNIYPCPMNSCPIVTSATRLPASPFWVEIKDGQCTCFAPQTCS